MQVSVRGMHCSSCSSAVERALKAQPGVQTATVALLKETAEVGGKHYHKLCLEEKHVYRLTSSPKGAEKGIAHAGDLHQE